MSKQAIEAIKLALDALEDCTQKFYAMKCTGVVDLIPVQAIKCAQAAKVLKTAITQLEGQETTPPAPARLTDQEIEECEELAGRSFRRFKSSIRGQLIVPQDSYEWHLAHAVMNALEKKRGEA